MAARVAFNMALDVLNFRGDPAVASGWIQRGRDFLRDRPASPWLGAIDLAEAWMALLSTKTSFVASWIWSTPRQSPKLGYSRDPDSHKPR
jgi:hypothetical protein